MRQEAKTGCARHRVDGPRPAFIDHGCDAANEDGLYRRPTARGLEEGHVGQPMRTSRRPALRGTPPRRVLSEARVAVWDLRRRSRSRIAVNEPWRVPLGRHVHEQEIRTGPEAPSIKRVAPAGFANASVDRMSRPSGLREPGWR
jgi:hypothetical protein